jgi:hypothetical protein
MIPLRQNFPRTPPVDIAASLAAGFARLGPTLRPGASIAVGVGSRGIARLPEIVLAVLAAVRATGAIPFIFPAMGSHGGATPAGQRAMLASYDITEATMGVPIRDSLEVLNVGVTEDGHPVHGSTEALAADGILLVNRIKPHTDFYCPTLGSGLLKMAVVGLGKRHGAAAMHLAASRHGHEHAIRTMAAVLLRTTPLLGGIAVLENQFHDTARIVVVTRDEMPTAENTLLAEARALMPLLPFDEIDLLIVDRIGKNISGTGMDPNIIHRSIDGYSTSLIRAGRPSPFIRRLFVRDLTEATHGNALGIGLADFTTARLARAIDPDITRLNALTALTPQAAKLPIVCANDREAIERALASLPLAHPSEARIVRIADTLSLVELSASEPFAAEIARHSALTPLAPSSELAFDSAGDLLPAFPLNA